MGRNLFYLLALMAGTILTTGAGLEESVCEGQKRKITCGNVNVITIETAEYGRRNNATCKHHLMYDFNCKAKSAKEIISRNCNGRHECVLDSSNNVFGDPCYGTYKYIQVKYSCSKGTPQPLGAGLVHTVCEGQRKKISCGKEQHITIEKAEYGRRNRVTCIHESMSDTNCNAGIAKDVISENCNGKRECWLDSSNNVFGDPCQGTHKYIQVQYSCSKASAGFRRFLGCYKEKSVQTRLMNMVYEVHKGTLTPDICVTHCRSTGYTYAGTQNGKECFCSNERPPFQRLAPLSECDVSCDGDRTQLCGGQLRLGVYELSDSGEDWAGANRMGCYRDDELGVLGNRWPGGAHLTPEYCVGYCHGLGYLLAGLRGKDCYCGDSIQGDLVNEGECDDPCVGNAHLICGGNYRTSVYHTSISDESEDGRLLGCFDDSGKPRLLSGYKVLLKETNSPRRCMNICLQLGFKFSGVEYGTECFCGNKTPEFQKEVNENQCSALCPRSNMYACGGNWRISIYSTSGAQGGNKVTGSPPKPQTEKPTLTPVQDQTLYCSKSRTEHGQLSVCEGELLFHEKFTSWTPGVWKHDIFMPDGPDYEFVVFNDNRNNVFLRNGKLVIKPSIFEDDFVRRGSLRLEKCSGRLIEECERQARGFSLLPPVQSARISTKESFSFKYGKVVVNARLPIGDWLIPEIWLEPKEHKYGPGYESGRIRIALAHGNKYLSFRGEECGSRMLQQSVLMGDEDKIKERRVTKINKRNKGWCENYHNFTLIWTPESIIFQVDDEEEDYIIRANSGKLYELVGFDKASAFRWEQGSPIAPFDQQFYISLGVSVGGMREFQDGCVTGGQHTKPWTNMAVKGLVDFWNDRQNWYPTWLDNYFGLEVEDVYIYAL